MSLRIVELAPTARGGYCPRGAALALWKCKGHEVILSGPAETGKTYGCLQKLDALLWKYPGARALMVRKSYKSVVTSCLQTYAKKVLTPGTPVRAYGGERPEWFDYPNGSRLHVGGMDNADKVLSSELDFIYANQAEELQLDDWEKLTTRATGRAGNSPYAQVLGDCNPGAPRHWILARSRAGGPCKLFESRHQDNPTLYDDAGGLTDQGRKTMAVLDALTGVRRQRLCLGRWVQAEGVVYDGWDAAVHLVGRFTVPPHWPRIWSVDFGFTNPFVCQFWAVDDDGRLWMYREVYLTRRLVEDHARRILEVARHDPAPVGIVCDHDLEDRMTLERHLGMPTAPALKAKRAGIQAVAARLKRAGDGRPRLLIMRDSLDELDPELVAAKKPTCTAEEVDSYVWDTRVNRKDGEEPVKADDHGMDAMRYVAYTLDSEGTIEEEGHTVLRA